MTARRADVASSLTSCARAIAQARIRGRPPSTCSGPIRPRYAATELFPMQLIKTDYKNFAPRVGIAYSPDSKTVVRARLRHLLQPGHRQRGVRYVPQYRGPREHLPGRGCAGKGCTWSKAAPAGQSAGGAAIAQVPPPYSYVDAYDRPDLLHDAVPVEPAAPVARQLAD